MKTSCHIACMSHDLQENPPSMTIRISHKSWLFLPHKFQRRRRLSWCQSDRIMQFSWINFLSHFFSLLSTKRLLHFYRIFIMRLPCHVVTFRVVWKIFIDFSIPTTTEISEWKNEKKIWPKFKKVNFQLKIYFYSIFFIASLSSLNNEIYSWKEEKGRRKGKTFLFCFIEIFLFTIERRVENGERKSLSQLNKFNLFSYVREWKKTSTLAIHLFLSSCHESTTIFILKCLYHCCW